MPIRGARPLRWATIGWVAFAMLVICGCGLFRKSEELTRKIANARPRIPESIEQRFESALQKSEFGSSRKVPTFSRMKAAYSMGFPRRDRTAGGAFVRDFGRKTGLDSFPTWVPSVMRSLTSPVAVLNPDGGPAFEFNVPESHPNSIAVQFEYPHPTMPDHLIASVDVFWESKNPNDSNFAARGTTERRVASLPLDVMDNFFRGRVRDRSADDDDRHFSRRRFNVHLVLDGHDSSSGNYVSEQTLMSLAKTIWENGNPAQQMAQQQPAEYGSHP